MSNWIAVLPVACAAALVAVVPTAVAAPNLSGTWTFVQQHSDDVREKIVASLGLGYAQDDARPDAPRAWVPDWLLAQAEKPGALSLTIEQASTEFKTGTGDDVRIYYVGRETTRQGPGGGLCKASVRWDGNRVIVEDKAEKGSGHIVEVYELQPDGRSLRVTWRLEHKAMRQPLELRLAFQKAAP